MIPKWFRKYQELATGAASAAASLGAVVTSPLMEYIIRKYGWRIAIRSGGIICLILSLLCSLSYSPLENTMNRVIPTSANRQISNVQNKNLSKTFH